MGTNIRAAGKALSALASAVKKSPRIAFWPSPALTKFYARGLQPHGRYLVRAANRVGKTTHAAVLVATAMEQNPGVRLRGISVDFTQQMRAMGRKMADYITPSALAPGCDFNETRGWSHNIIRLRNGSSLQLMNNTQDTQTFEGDEVDGVWFDEPPKQVNWLPNISRVMSSGGWILVTATMVGVPVTYLRDIVEADDSDWDQYVVPFSKEACPWYSQRLIDRWLADVSAAPWEYEQRVNASWEGVALGRRFTGFTPESIISSIEGGRWTVGVGIDHGEGKGKQAAVLVFWNAETIILVDTYINDNPTTPAQDAVAIKEMLRKYNLQPAQVDVWKGDSNTAGKARVGLTVNDMLGAELGVYIGRPDKRAGSVETGEYLINLALLTQKMKVLAPVSPTLDYVLRYYHGEEENKHLVDATRYITREPLGRWNMGGEFSRLYWRR